MKNIGLFVGVLLAFSFFAACSSNKEEQALGRARTYADYINTGKRIAVQAGDVYGKIAQDIFKAKDAPEYLTVADMLESLRMGKIDAALLSHSYIRQLVDSGSYPNVDYLWVPEDVYVNKAGPVFYTTGLRDKYNEWFRGIAANGTWDKILDRWIGAPLPAQKDIPKFKFTGENGTLRVCDTGNYPPLIYFDANNEPAGFDVEMISLFAQHMGMKPEFTMMAYEAIGPYVVSGKADMSSATLTITDERKKGMIFGEPSVITQAVLIVPKTGADKVSEKAIDYTYFAGKEIAVMTGVLTYITTEKIGGKPINYNDSSSAAEDVRQGRVAGYMHALSAVQVMAAQLGGFEAIAVPKDIFSAQIGAISHDQDVINRFNAFLPVLEADGTLKEMKSRWFGSSLDLKAPIPEIKNPGKNGVLKVAICSDSIPYVYVGANGNFSGFSVELALRFGAHEGKIIEFTNMEFGGLIPYIVSKKADFGIANMAITAERKKSVLFSDPFFDEQHGILALKQSVGTPVVAAPAVSAISYTDFVGKKLGVYTGTICEQVTVDINAIPAYYSDLSAGLEDVRKGRIAGYMTDLSMLRVLAASPGNEDLLLIKVPIEFFIAPMGAISANQDIINRFNVFLSRLVANGTLAEIQDRWLENMHELDPAMPDIQLAGTNGTLRIATSGTEVPFAYTGANGQLKGYCIELALRFAVHEGMDVEFADMDFSGLIPYVLGGKADLAISTISITDERKKSVLFSDSIYDDQFGIITLKNSEGALVSRDHVVKKGGFASWLKTGIERNLITDNRWRMIVNGLGTTMLISLSAHFFGTVFGCFVCFVLTRKNKIVRKLGSMYCGLVYGTPVVVLLMITYYIIFGNTNISNVIVAIAAFTIVMGAGIAQNLKGAIDTVDPVEIEAARSIGFSSFNAFLTVTLPQAIRRALPGYTNSFVELVKATAIVGFIAIQDLTRAGDIIRSRTYDAYFPLLFVAAIYLIVTTICVQLFKFVVRKANKGAVQ